MNVYRVLGFPIIGLMIVSLLLLSAGGFAVLIHIGLSLISAPLSPSPIHGLDLLEMVSAFHVVWLQSVA
jgi:hypothetical protein